MLAQYQTQTIKKKPTLKQKNSLMKSEVNDGAAQNMNAQQQPDRSSKVITRNKKLGASSEDLSEIDDLESYGEDCSGNGISGGKGTSKLNFPISSDSNQSKSEEEKKNPSNTSFSNEGGGDSKNHPSQVQPEYQIFEKLTFLK